jgi:hypothetical protein
VPPPNVMLFNSTRCPKHLPRAHRLLTTLSSRRPAAVVLVAAAMVLGTPDQRALSTCNVIPGVRNAFQGVRGTLDRPFASPGDWVDVSLDRDSELTPAGLSHVLLTAGPDGKAKIRVEGRGANLALPALVNMTSPVTAQFSNGDMCWEAVYSAPFLKLTPGLFRDTAD